LPKNDADKVLKRELIERLSDRNEA